MSATFRLARLALASAALAFVVARPCDASAQGRARAAAWTPPVELALVPWPGDAASPRPYRYVLVLTASREVEIILDARLVGLEITVPGRRRPHRCQMPGRPRRADESLARRLRRGEHWAEWLDLRELCWGRALDAITANTPGTTARVTYEVGRGAHAWVAREIEGAHALSARALAGAEVRLPSASEEVSVDGEAPAVRVTLAPSDARRGGPSLRVAVVAGGSVRRRAWLRPDRFVFRVVDPSGESFECGMPRTPAAAIPDLFSRLDPRRAVRFSLDAGEYCGDEAFEAPGVYEVTPVLFLDEDGSRWDLDAVVGTFEGPAVPVRVRGARGEREVPADVLRELLR